MGRYAKDSGGGDFQQAPAGNHVARCIRLIDLGTQHTEYQGKALARNQILITWELPDERMENGDPFIVSSFFTNSLSEKSNLRPFLEAWRSRTFTAEELAGFDLETIVNVPCMLSVVHTDKGKSRVSSAGALPKGIKCPPAVNEQFCYWIDEHEPAIYEKIGEGLRKIIEQSDEWKARATKPKSSGGSIMDMQDDVPFLSPYAHGVWRVV